jgi:cytochrome c
MSDTDNRGTKDRRNVNRRRVIQTMGGLGVAGLAGVVSGKTSQVSNETPTQFRTPKVGTDPAILVVSLTPGFRHGSIPAGNQAIQELGDRIAEMSDADEVVVDIIDSVNDNTPPTEFPTDAGELSQYDVLVFNSSNDANPPQSTETLVLNDEQAAAFEKYIRSGGGFVGIHSAVDNQTDGSFFNQMFQTYYEGHPAVQDVEIIIEDPSHPSTNHLPKVWEETIEPYDFLTNPREDVHVLASLDESSYENAGMEGTDHPITWAQYYAGGRSWYTGLGHRPEFFENEQFRGHLLGGIMWAAGYVPGGAIASTRDEQGPPEHASGRRPPNKEK